MNFTDKINNILGKKPIQNILPLRFQRQNQNMYLENRNENCIRFNKNGAPLGTQRQWRNMSPRRKYINRMKFKDLDE